MNIGIIIFVISIIATIISTLRDKSHEERQNQKPPSTPKENQQPKKGGFFEEFEKTFKELSDEINGETSSDKKRTFDDNLPPLNQEIENSKPTSEELHRRPTDYDDSIPKPDPTPYHNEKEVREPVKQSTSRDESAENLRKELESNLHQDLKNVRSEIDREKEKQLALIEKKAQDIINDKYLSERTKRVRLKQLFNSQNVERNMSKSAFQFDNDEIVNGIIWNEILNKPKQL
ncbi:iron transporter [Staphylococcus pasteuri]|uniref:iron transporter n=1 Tax=Staphylococcus pasteuri TaxID=45972 RepID=UPI002DB870D4|nr:iron transporter [Staphylococcus pasteuri]MEB6611402.1 iron transporter [Staphylococcus pasteuri]